MGVFGPCFGGCCGGTFIVEVSKGSGVPPHPTEVCSFTLFPRRPFLGIFKRVWFFEFTGIETTRNIYLSSDCYYEDLNAQFVDDDDCLIVDFNMPVSSDDWKFCADDPIVIKSGEVIPQDLHCEVRNDGKQLHMTLRFIDGVAEILPFYFRAYYGNNPDNIVESKDPVIIISRRPPK